jgi:hypothetical protein
MSSIAEHRRRIREATNATSREIERDALTEHRYRARLRGAMAPQRVARADMVRLVSLLRAPPPR